MYRVHPRRTDAFRGVTYASWATTGNPFATGTYSVVVPLNGTDIAVMDSTSSDDLSTLRWDGSDFTQVGNAFSLTTGNNDGLIKLSTTRVAVLDTINEELRAYTFDGTNWTQTGNTFSLTMGVRPRGAFLSDNAIVVHNATGGGGSGFAKFTFDGTDFTKVGNTFTDTSGENTFASLSASRIVALSTGDDDIKTYDFDDTDWTQTGNTFAISPTIAGSYGIAALSSTQILYFNSNTQVQTLIFDGTDWTKEGSESTLTGLSSWPRSIVKMSDTLTAYHSFSDADVRAATATLS